MYSASMAIVKLKLTGMAHGGHALGRDKRNQVIFVAGGIPGEMVEVEITPSADKKKFFAGELKRVLKPSKSRQPTKHEGIGPHGGYTYAHIKYQAQLDLKRSVALDQLKRLGGISIKSKPFTPSPLKWEYDHDVVLSPTKKGGFGLWDNEQREVVTAAGPLRSLVPTLQHLMSDFDFELPGLRRLTLRASTQGDGDSLVAFEIEGVEPPELLVDFPISAAIVLPDKTMANLIGDSFVVREVDGDRYRISAGCEFAANPAVAGLMAKKVVELADLSGKETVLDCYSGVGLLSKHLAKHAAELHGIDRHPDAIADAAINLAETDNVSLYEGHVEEILPMLELKPDVVIVNPPVTGLSKEALASVTKLQPQKLIYVSGDVATLARDSKLLKKSGYRATHLSGFDMLPQTFHMSLVMVWEKR